MVPCTNGDVINFLDAAENGGEGVNGILVTDPNNAEQGGTDIERLTFFGLWNSCPGDTHAIIAYGPTRWGDYFNLSSWGLKGCLICTGVDAGENGMNPKGQYEESVFWDIRAETTGDKSAGVPAFDLSGFGNTSAPDNDVIVRYRAYDTYGVAFRSAPCTTGNPLHQQTWISLKIESSTLEGNPNASDEADIGANPGYCGTIKVPSVSGQTPVFNNESGMGQIELVAPVLGNPTVNNYGLHILGAASSDVQQLSIWGLNVNDTGVNHGIGIQMDASGSGNVIDLA